jgi:tetratricopeptide (TPR) repeat protein
VKVFVCHSSGDKPVVRDLYRKLVADGFNPWLDEIDLIPGQVWRDAIEAAVEASDAVIVCLSRGSVSKEGYLQKEIKIAIDVADQKPEGTIFIIPVRLEDVEIPRRLRELQWANLYEERGYERLVAALRQRAARTAGPHPPEPPTAPGPIPKPPFIDPIPPPPKPKWQLWIQSHLTLIFVLSSLTLAAAVLTGIALYKSREQDRDRGIQLAAAGVEKLHSFDTGEAESLLRQAVAADPKNAMAHANLAITLAERGNYTVAQSEGVKAGALKRQLNERERLFVDGISAEMNWQFEPAIASYGEAWKHQDVDAGLRLARVQTLSGKGSAALDTLQELRNLPIVSAASRIDYETALTADALGNFDKELEVLKQIALLHQSQPLIVATVLAQECYSLYRNGRLKEAADPCEKSTSIFTDKGEQLGRARALTRWSLVLAQGDQPDQQKALTFQGEAIDIVRGLGAEFDEAGALQNRSNLLINLNRYEEARSDYEAAGVLFKKIGFKEGSAALENNWATLLLNSCRYQEAKDKFELARQTYTAMEKQDGIAATWSNIGATLYFLGDLAGAERALKEALRISDTGNMALDKSTWLILLGDVYTAQNKAEWAELCFRGQKCYVDVPSSKIKNRNSEILEGAEIDYASMLVETGRVREAERVARAQVLKAKGKDPEEEASALDVIAKALVQQGGTQNLGQALGAIAEAQSLGSQSCTTSLSLAITSASISAHQRQFDLARTQVSNSIRRAAELKLLGYRLRALLVEAEIELLAGDSTKTMQKLESLSRSAESSGFVLIQNESQSLMSSAKSGPRHSGDARPR